MTKMQRCWLAVSLIALAVLVYLLTPVIVPFVIAALLAYLGNPVVEWLQRRRLPRTLAVVLVFFLMLAVLLFTLGLLLPLLQRQIGLLIAKIPTVVLFIEQIALPWLNQFLVSLGLDQYAQSDSLKTLLSNNWQQAGSYAATFWHTLSHSSLALMAWIVNLLLIPVVTFYLLRDWHVLLHNGEELIPRRHAAITLRLLNQCDTVLSAFFKGQLLVMLALATIYSLGLTLLGLQVGLLIGLIAGLLSIVPYLGFTIGLLSATIAALLQFHDGWHLLYVVIVFMIGNALEGMVLTPWLVGDKIGLHPVAVIFAILAGGQLFGFIGILVALPVAAVTMVFLRELRQHYLQGGWYR